MSCPAPERRRSLTSNRNRPPNRGAPPPPVAPRGVRALVPVSRTAASGRARPFKEPNRAPDPPRRNSGLGQKSLFRRLAPTMTAIPAAGRADASWRGPPPPVREANDEGPAARKHHVGQSPGSPHRRERVLAVPGWPAPPPALPQNRPFGLVTGRAAENPLRGRGTRPRPPRPPSP